MARAGPLLLLTLLAARCSAGSSGSPPAEEPPETTAASSERTGVPEAARGAPEEARALPVEQIFSGTPEQGPESPEVFVAPSRGALERRPVERGRHRGPRLGRRHLSSGLLGPQADGGRSLAVESVRLEGGRVTVRLALHEPPRMRS